MKRAYVYLVVALLLVMITGCPAFWKAADATLKELLYNGVEVPEFSAKKTDYSIVLPSGTTEPPTVTAVPAVEGANIVISNAETLPGTATVLVTSLNGKESLTYSIFFTVKVVISITADPPNGGEFSGDGEYIYGDLVTIMATPSIHHTFSGWYLDEPEEASFEESGDDPIYTEPVVSFQALKDVSLMVGFNPMQYTFNLVPVPPEGGEVAGGGAVDYGDSLNLSAWSSEGYGFAGWWIDSYMFSDQAVDMVNTIEILEHTECITCTEFTVEGRFDPSAPQWHLDVTIEATPVYGGETWGAGLYPYGSYVTVVATPSDHFNFDGWYFDGVQLSEGATYTFPANEWYTEGATYTAIPLQGVFEDIQYSFNAVAEPPEGGTATGGGTAAYGDIISFLAVPNESYTFEGWYYGEENMSGSPSFSLDTSSFLDTHTLPITSTENSFIFAAKFQPQTPPPGWLLITIDASPTDKGEFSGAGKYSYGEDVTLGATPIEHYDFGGWYTDGEMLSEDLPYTFNTSEWLPTQGVTDTLPIVAWFPPVFYHFNVVANPPEGGKLWKVVYSYAAIR
ncbi:InlB B-repeat-containing protein [Mesotoga sp.]|uniref:InlB B-repeat-containing protein n=1 Tax=Mesotoga sp. TaxID=2053577 RepID=UPI00345E6464